MLPAPLALMVRREWLARRVAAGVGHRELEIDLLPRFVRPTDICWDIGASSGTYTVALSRLASKVLAFEPIPHSLEILEKVKQRAHLTNVTIEPLAISDSVGPARMAVPLIDGFYGGYYMAGLDPAGDVDVTTASIDHLIDDGRPEPDFIKCDVEGAEGRVIAGARRLIERRHPTWLLETFDDQIVSLVESLGYAVYVNAGRRDVERVRERRPTHRNYFLVWEQP